MAKTLMLAVALMLSAAWLVAQQDKYPSTSSPQTGATTSGQTAVEGCLEGSNGNYTLTDKSGTKYQLQGDTSKLSEHVGHEVKISGSTSGSAASSSTGTTPSTAAGGQPTLTVDKVKHIAKTCKATSK